MNHGIFSLRFSENHTSIETFFFYAATWRCLRRSMAAIFSLNSFNDPHSELKNDAVLMLTNNDGGNAKIPV